MQLYVQPLISVGDYEGFKELTNTPTLDYKAFGTAGSEIIYDESSNSFIVDPDASGPAQSFSFNNPDFNFKSLRGNLVLRWEALPGSVFILPGRIAEWIMNLQVNLILIMILVIY